MRRNEQHNVPMECISPLSMFALSRFDMAKTVQLRSALRLLLGHFLEGPSVFSSVASSEQSFRRFMNNVKYLQKQTITLKSPLYFALKCFHTACPAFTLPPNVSTIFEGFSGDTSDTSETRCANSYKLHII